MRNIQLFTLFFFLPSLSFGQEIYRPFLEEGKVWTYHYYNDFTGKEYYKSLTIGGDTIFGDNSYKRIVDVATGNFEYAIREEGKKVFCANPNNAETLIYDFGLNVGDSFQSSGNSNSDTQTTVIGVDTVVVGNRAFRILDVRLNNDLWPNLWVEGVGGMYDLSSNFPKVGNFYSFSSCQLDGETILTQKDVWKTVGIQNQLISNKDSYDNHLFDLHGRRIQGEPKGKGIYVKNRKKIVMK